MRNNDTFPTQLLSDAQLSVKKAVKLLGDFAHAVNPQLGEQMVNVAKLARRVGEEIQLETDYIDQLEMAGMIHDIGLLVLPRELQNKEIRLLTKQQYLLYCEHPVTASIALEGIETLSLVGEMVLFHHEYMNGKGFPNGLAGERIPIASRILLVVSDYCRILSTWPRNIRRLINHARRHLGLKEWSRLTYSEDPETIIEESAEKLLQKDPEGKYDVEVIQALIRILHKNKNIDSANMIRLDDLKAGMVLMDDLYLDGGRLLITKGAKLANTSIQTLQGLGLRGMIPRKLYVAKHTATKGKGVKPGFQNP